MLKGQKRLDHCIYTFKKRGGTLLPPNPQSPKTRNPKTLLNTIWINLAMPQTTRWA